jgi:hypothetical protein
VAIWRPAILPHRWSSTEISRGKPSHY